LNTYNRVLLLGRVGHSPELRTTRNGRAFCRMSVATDGFSRGEGEAKSCWHSVHVFGNQAERAVLNLEKGAAVFVEGHMESTAVEREGATVWSTWITADKLSIIPRGSKNSAAPETPSSNEKGVEGGVKEPNTEETIEP